MWSEANKIWWKDYYKRRREHRLQLTKNWRKRNPERVRELARKHDSRPASKETKHRWVQKNRKKLNIQHKKRMQAIRDKVLDGYGGRCVCCGEDHKVFLAIDHVHNDGAVERRLKNTWKFYTSIVKEGFPNRYQVLCHNCNWAKSHGGCPHPRVLRLRLA